jgi:hypothetical protein
MKKLSLIFLFLLLVVSIACTSSIKKIHLECLFGYWYVITDDNIGKPLLDCTNNMIKCEIPK